MTITKVMLEYSTGSGMFKIRPSAELPLPDGWAQKAYIFAYKGETVLALRAKGWAYSRNLSIGETLRVTFGKFHLIFRSN